MRIAYFGVVRAVLAFKDGTPSIDARMRGWPQLDKVARLPASSCSTVASARASSATSVTSAAWISRVSTFHPATSTSDGVALRGRIQHVADRLQRGIGHADMDGAGEVADLQLEAVDTTISLGVAMLANCGCIPERWYVGSSG